MTTHPGVESTPSATDNPPLGNRVHHVRADELDGYTAISGATVGSTATSCSSRRSCPTARRTPTPASPSSW